MRMEARKSFAFSQLMMPALLQEISLAKSVFSGGQIQKTLITQDSLFIRELRNEEFYNTPKKKSIQPILELFSYPNPVICLIKDISSLFSFFPNRIQCKIISSGSSRKEGKYNANVVIYVKIQLNIA